MFVNQSHAESLLHDFLKITSKHIIIKLHKITISLYMFMITWATFLHYEHVKLFYNVIEAL